jgi:glyoxylase-like metal-dependent hydrolase (beta-lactamase superfamily II)
MKRNVQLAACAALFAVLSSSDSALAQAGKSGVERLYVLDCGQGRAADQSLWSPGVNIGKAFDVSDNCYLIKHAQGWFLWDTGVPDAVAAMPDGMPPSNPRATAWHRAKTLAAQVDALGVKPADIKYMAVSHTHGDHSGNVELYPHVMLLVQKAEYDWPGPNNSPRFKSEHPVTKLQGDHDVFGDGSVTLISTPGHTPGHQSLLVRLPQTGPVVLSGDAAHFKDNWDNRRVPELNTSKDQTLASMQRIADILATEHAQLWINHDAAQTSQLKHAPDYYE